MLVSDDRRSVAGRCSDLGFRSDDGALASVRLLRSPPRSPLRAPLLLLRLDDEPFSRLLDDLVSLLCWLELPRPRRR
ncbi:MAG: hypothetical protein MUP76_11120, partial [Acidimicrobiia bacterium]|nr:hypothetical protein [Acidimicrobiia bacterium]